MRHRVSRSRLSYKPAHSNMLQRNLVTSVLLYEKVRTTLKRAQVVRPQIDQLITLAKKKNAMNAIRAINMVVTDTNASRKVMQVLKERYKTRPSGFTRIVPLGLRQGDGAKLVSLELVDSVLASDEKAEKAVKAEKKVSSKKK
jgi:large subunit ribosomal protein L17